MSFTQIDDFFIDLGKTQLFYRERCGAPSLPFVCQRNHCDFLGHAHPEGHGAADARVDVERLAAFGVESVAVGIDPAGGRPAENAELCRVGVARESQRYVCAEHLAAPVRGVVREQYAESARAAQRLRQVATLDGTDAVAPATLVFTAQDGERVAAAHKHLRLVQQEVPPQHVAFRLNQPGHRLCFLLFAETVYVGGVVVVA